MVQWKQAHDERVVWRTTLTRVCRGVNTSLQSKTTNSNTHWHHRKRIYNRRFFNCDVSIYMNRAKPPVVKPQVEKRSLSFVDKCRVGGVCASFRQSTIRPTTTAQTHSESADAAMGRLCASRVVADGMAPAPSELLRPCKASNYQYYGQASYPLSSSEQLSRSPAAQRSTTHI